MNIYFIRHGVTPWNDQKKFQGRTDIPLSEKGIKDVSSWQMPKHIEHWFVSPLTRARQTASLHQLEPITISDDLIEANWGQWEGKILKQLRKENPQYINNIESQGLDMRPPGGESPREVRARLMQFLSKLNSGYKRIGIITHRGVIRAALSQATGWDMKSDHEVNITHNHAYEFDWRNSDLHYLSQHPLIEDEAHSSG